MFIDTHCHLHDSEFFTPEQQSAFLSAAKSAGVEEIICIGTDPEDSLVARDFAATHDGVYWTFGIHPESANDRKLVEIAAEASQAFLNHELALGGRGSKSRPEQSEGFDFESAPTMKKSLTRFGDNDYKLVAIGEIGLDYHYAGYDRQKQIRLFETMLRLAQEYDLPVSLHIREAFPDAFAVLDNFPRIRGVVHSFTGNKRELKQALDRGFYIGVNGLATYSTLPLPPLDRILLETDAPFLTPAPFRGTINKPEYVREIAAYLATQLGVKELKIAEQTTKNARRVFNIKQRISAESRLE